jgi:hypothetical protein
MEDHHIAATAGVTALALAAGGYTWKKYEDAMPRCSQVMLAAPKGGPGSLEPDIYPAIEGTLQPIHNVHSAVVSGLNTDKFIVPSQDDTHGVLKRYTWDASNNSLQQPRIQVSGELDGRAFDCREQTVTLIPDETAVGPVVPQYPPF